MPRFDFWGPLLERANTEPVLEVCGTCRYSTPTGTGDLECRRYPPTVIEYPAEITTIWPLVRQSYWCDEWGERTG